MARRRPPTNAEIARALRELALFLEMEGVPYRPRAYEKAALSIEAQPLPLAALDAESGAAGLETLAGVGHGIAGRIEELLRTGRLAELERLRARRPVDVLALTRVEGVGPKTARVLHDRLGVRTLDDLDAACRGGRLREIPRFGARSEARILRALELARQASGRRLLGEVLPLAAALERRLAALPGVRAAHACGSLRRRCETIGDLDLLVVSTSPVRVADAFAAFPEVAEVSGRGDTKLRARLRDGLDVDLRIVPPGSAGAALLYFTGSKAHAVALRRRAQARGWLLNEYGLHAGARPLAGDTEEAIYAALGLAWIAPELREDRGEIEAAAEGRLPELLAYGALRGDLHVQTSWSDGRASIEEMVEAARALGLQYLAVTDPTRGPGTARGLDEERLLAQADAIAKLDRRLHGFRVLAGAGVGVREDGSLEVADDALARLDIVGAAIRSRFDLPRAAQTRRVLRALESPHVDVLFHPSARRVGRRPPIDVDWDAVLAAAARTATVLEVDALPDRLDLRDELVRRAVEAGVALAVDSDAHAPRDLAYADTLGVATARRGWATREDVVNAWPVDRLLARLDGGRAAAGTSRRKATARGVD